MYPCADAAVILPVRITMPRVARSGAAGGGAAGAAVTCGLIRLLPCRLAPSKPAPEVRFFSIITRQAIRRASFTSVQDLTGQPGQLPPPDCGTVALTVPEAQRLFRLLATLTRSLPSHAVRALIARHLGWSDWRRRHQARARWHHYRTRLAGVA